MVKEADTALPTRTRMSRANCPLSALLFLAAVAGWAMPSPAAGRSLVLITLDTTRADHLGCYGWPYARTPNLDALARRGVRFSHCDTAAPITLPSHATILTGLYPPRHGVRDNGTFALPARVETVASRLRAAGYDTAAVVSAIVLARRHGLDRGFRIYDDDLGTGYAASTDVSERQAEATTAAALAVLAQLRPPFFVWVHYFDAHEEYRPPTRFADSISGPHRLYDGEIAYVDEQLGALLGKLSSDVDVAVVGDHGEMLGEHGELTHGLLPYRGAREVPLLLAGPDVPSGRVVDCLVRTADVTPTLLSWAGLALPTDLDGATLSPLPAGSGCDRPSYTESFLPFFAYKWYPLRALSDGRFFYIRGPHDSLYRRAEDPGEAFDVVNALPVEAARWKQRLDLMLAGMGESLEPDVRPDMVLSAEQREHLASLGYLEAGGGSRVREKLPDPRSMTAVAQELHRAVQRVQEGKCPEVLPQLEAIVQGDPHNFPALSLAGECLRDAGRHEAALAAFRRAAQEHQLSAVPVANIAGALLRLGRKDEAMQEYRRALSLDPTQPVAASNLARLLRDGGDRAGALQVLDEALAAGCHAPAVLLERGVALAESGRVADGLASFRESARRNPADPLPLENAARAAYQLGRYRESAQLYEVLLRLSAARGDVWKTLGAVYLFQLDDRPNALRAFREALRLEIDPRERAKVEQLVRELSS
jgi:choline-sulfatase